LILNGEVPRRGEIWVAEVDKVRPVVIMHRDFAGRRLSAVLAAPLTSTVRDIPTAVRLGIADGLDRECIASLDNLTLVSKSHLRHPVGRLSAERMAQLCRALATAVQCAEWNEIGDPSS
jgi:mRNA interferase MazF